MNICSKHQEMARGTGEWRQLLNPSHGSLNENVANCAVISEIGKSCVLSSRFVEDFFRPFTSFGYVPPGIKPVFISDTKTS